MRIATGGLYYQTRTQKLNLYTEFFFQISSNFKIINIDAATVLTGIPQIIIYLRHERN